MLDMEDSLPRECELTDEGFMGFVASLWRLFGLFP
jgi:hypothetical protein